MASLKSSLKSRIKRLPKPKNAAEALQPTFEAVSNSIHAIHQRWPKEASSKGRVDVYVNTNRDKEDVTVEVSDNGLGLNEENWNAFITMDTPNKIDMGGKGVGRLLWLDCFNEINVESRFKNPRPTERRFEFALSDSNQIRNLTVEPIKKEFRAGTTVSFAGLREGKYKAKFPGRETYIKQHFISHFLPSFVSDGCPRVFLHLDSEIAEFPKDMSEIIHRKDVKQIKSHDLYGNLALEMLECDKIASADLKGHHFIHFIAHNRTVLSQKIDGKLGLNYFGAAGDRTFHALLRGEYLDENVNQQRTAFEFEDKVINQLVNDVCFKFVEKFLVKPLEGHKEEQRKAIKKVVGSYPSVAFGDTKSLQERIPSGELSTDAIYGHLSRERYRRDERQAEKIKIVLERLKGDSLSADDLSSTLQEATDAIESAEQKSLAEYVIRRNVVLSFIEELVKKTRLQPGDASYQREDVLHTLISPVRTQSVNGKSKVYPAASHDLWILDERLTFASYFSSDVEFSKLSELSDNDQRPDLILYDHVHGLRTKGDDSSIMLVEFKRPGRKSYNSDENPQFQVERYVRELLNGSLQNVDGRPIKLDERTRFYCYIVADIVGRLDDWTMSWGKSVDGRTRIYKPDALFKGTIELVGWDELLSDARLRNSAFFDAMGLTNANYFDVS